MSVEKPHLEIIADEVVARYVQQSKHAPTMLERELSLYVAERARKIKDPLAKIQRIATTEYEIAEYALSLKLCTASETRSGPVGHSAAESGTIRTEELDEENQMLEQLAETGFVEPTDAQQQLILNVETVFKNVPIELQRHSYIKKTSAPYKLFKITEKGKTALAKYEQQTYAKLVQHHRMKK